MAIRNVRLVLDLVVGQSCLAANCHVENLNDGECVRIHSICQEISLKFFSVCFLSEVMLSVNYLRVFLVKSENLRKCGLYVANRS